MIGIFLFGVPVVAGSLSGAIAAYGLSKYNVSSSTVFCGCTAGVALSVATIRMYPPGGVHKGENWMTFVSAGTVAVMSISVMGWYCVGIVFPFMRGIMEDYGPLLFISVGVMTFVLKNNVFR